VGPCGRMKGLYRFIRQCHSAGADRFVVMHVPYQQKTSSRHWDVKCTQYLYTLTIYMVAQKK